MFRDDRDALIHQHESLTREAERLRAENAAMREQILAAERGSQPAALRSVYTMDPAELTPGERAALAQHRLTAFPVWAMVALTLLTFGFFPLIRFGLDHDKLPKAHPSDPSSGRAIGFTFIPYFNLYWVFFNSLRLADRLNLQFKLRGEEPGVSRGLMITCSVFSVIPYLNVLLAPILWTFGASSLQRAVNRLAANRDAPAPSDGPALPDPFAEPPAGLLGE